MCPRRKNTLPSRTQSDHRLTCTIHRGKREETLRNRVSKSAAQASARSGPRALHEHLSSALLCLVAWFGNGNLKSGVWSRQERASLRFTLCFGAQAARV